MNGSKRTWLTVLVMTALAGNAWAADTVDGAGSGVAIGTGSSAPKAENVAVGKNAKVQYSNGASMATGDVAIGAEAGINNYASQGGSIAIGHNAKIENMAGSMEAEFALGQTTYSGSLFSSARIPADPTKAPGSIAIGQNTFTRTGSTMIGVHNYKGALGDREVDSAATRKDNLNVYATTIGANSHNNAAFGSVTGAFSIISSSYNGGRFSTPTKGLGATINGALNSIETMSGDSYDGIANSIMGLANRTAKANGALIYGAGNTITNSTTRLSNVPSSGGNSAKELQDKLMQSIKSSKAGGATMAFGGGNTADYTLRSAIIGVNNTLTGTQGKESKENFLVGFENTGANVNQAIVIGTKQALDGASRSIVMGSSTKAVNQTMVEDVVIIGTDAKATVAGGVALGLASVANRGVNEGAGYDLLLDDASQDTTSVWNPTHSAVSVGNGTDVTRRITSVAAGKDDTDAVNVAQLKQAMAKQEIQAAKASVYKGDTGTVTVANGGTLTVTGGATDVTDGNIGVVAKDGKLEVKLAQDVTGLNSISIKDGPSMSKDGIDAHDTKITNVQDGAVNANSKDAVNGKQLHEVITKINGVQGNVGNLADKVDKNTKDIKAAKDGINGLDGKVSTLTDKVDANTQAITTVKDGLNGIDGKISTLDGKVTVLDGKVGQNGKDIAAVKDGLNGLDGKVTILGGKVDKNTQDIGSLKDGLNGLDGKVTDLGTRVDGIDERVTDNTKRLDALSLGTSDVHRRIDKVGASSAALAGLHPVDFDADDKFSMAVAGGFYKGSQAIALGAFYRPNEDTMVSLASTIATEDPMVNVGVSFKVGGSDKERKLKDTYKDSPISTVYVLEAEIEQLKAAHKADQERIAKLETALQELLAK